jgi:hypothetical protein
MPAMLKPNVWTMINTIVSYAGTTGVTMSKGFEALAIAHSNRAEKFV